MRLILACVLMIAGCSSLAAAGWVKLFNGRNLDGWEAIGNGVWHVMKDGTLAGQRDTKKGFFEEWPVTRQQYNAWLYNQAWLYTRKDFGEFDLELEYWLRYGGNSGISIRDTSRAQHAVTVPADFRKTPSKIGYEIQLNNQYPDQFPSGSIYTFQKAETGRQVDDEWNTMLIESRKDMIRVSINGQVVAQHAGDPARSKTGPIGLQLHDQYSVVKFRNIRIREVPGK